MAAAPALATVLRDFEIVALPKGDKAAVDSLNETPPAVEW